MSVLVDFGRAVGELFFGASHNMDKDFEAEFVLNKRARSLEESHTLDKDKKPHYYKKLAKFLQAMDFAERCGIPVCIIAFGFSFFVGRDVAVLVDIKEEKKANNPEKVKELAEQALKQGIQSCIVQKVVGDSFDIALLDTKSEAEQVASYLDQHNEKCPICLEEFTRQDFVSKTIHKTVCNHYFHETCIGKECAIRASCPTCRRKIDLVEERPLWKSFLNQVHDKILGHSFKNDVATPSSAPEEDDETQRQRRAQEAQREAEEHDHEIARLLDGEINGSEM